MKRILTTSASAAIAIGFAATAFAASISVNFALKLDDGNQVDPGETSVVGNPDGVSIDGSNWNNVQLRETATTPGVPDLFIANTTGGNSITLVDDSGANAASMTSALASNGGYTAYSNVSYGSQNATGDAGLFQSYLSFGAAVPSETITILDLGTDFTDNGYKVAVFFDMGSNYARTYGISIGTTTYWTADVSGTDGDPDTDGVITWTKTTATTSGTATTANYAVFTGLTSDSFTLSGVSIPNTGRSAISGLQVIAVPEPGSASLLLLGAGLVVRRGRR